MNEREVINALQKDVEIPEIVRKKADAALASIKAEAAASGQVSAEKTAETVFQKRKPAGGSLRKRWIAAAAAVAAVGTVTVGAAVYSNWSRSLGEGLQTTEDQRAEMEENHMTAPVNQSVTEQGITVTAQQSIVDRYYAHLSFKVEGYSVEEGVQPDFEFVKVLVDGKEVQLGGANFYDGLVQGEDGMAVKADGSPLPAGEDGTMLVDYHMEDGSLEYQVLLENTEEAGGFFDKPIHVELNNLGTVAKAQYEPDIQATWGFDWTLPGADSIRTCDLNVPLGDGETTVVQAEISPISLSATLKFPRKEDTEGLVDDNGEPLELGYPLWVEPPRLMGVRMKDGTLYPYLYLSSGYEGYVDYDNEDSEEYFTSFAIDRVLDIDQVDSLLFYKKGRTPEEPVTEDLFYVVPLNG